MVTPTALSSLVPLLVSAQGQAPPDDEVVAGWTGFAVFIGLVLAVAVLGYFLTKQLKRVDRAQADGVFGDPVEAPERRDGAAGGKGTAAGAETGSAGDPGGSGGGSSSD